MRIEFHYVAENADGAPINTTLVMRAPSGRWNVFENKGDNVAYDQFYRLEDAQQCASDIALAYENPINKMPPR